MVDTSYRTSGGVSAVRGHVVMLINKNTKAASTIHWTSKKIERVVHSSAAAETMAMQKMFNTIFFVRKVLEEMCGQRVKDLQCVVLTDNQELLSKQAKHQREDCTRSQTSSFITQHRRHINKKNKNWMDVATAGTNRPV